MFRRVLTLSGVFASAIYAKATVRSQPNLRNRKPRPATLFAALGFGESSSSPYQHGLAIAKSGNSADHPPVG